MLQRQHVVGDLVQSLFKNFGQTRALLRVFEIGFAGHPLFFTEGVVTPTDGSFSVPAVVMLLITAWMGVDVDVLPVGVLVADTLFSHAHRL